MKDTNRIIKKSTKWTLLASGIKKLKIPIYMLLKNSKFFIVTSDSTSMISECAFTGKPIYVYHLPFKRISKRISNFHERI